jgi:uncharacterized membrane protein (Fun14 family)
MIEINLLPDGLKGKTKTNKAFSTNAVKPDIKYLLRVVPFMLGMVIFIHLYLGLVGIIKSSQLVSLNNKWRGLDSQRKALESFNQEHMLLSEDAKAIQRASQERLLWAQKLNSLSLDLPSGVWFDEVSLLAKNFILHGSVVSLQKQEMSLINKFIDNLKNDSAFFKDFVRLELDSVEHKSLGGYDVVDFTLTGVLR